MIMRHLLETENCIGISWGIGRYGMSVVGHTGDAEWYHWSIIIRFPWASPIISDDDKITRFLFRDWRDNPVRYSLITLEEVEEDDESRK